MTFAQRLASVDAWLAGLRGDDLRRRLALVGGVVVGLGFAWVHWTGLVVGGAVVGLTRQNVPRAVVAALVFGVLATLVGVGVTPTVDIAEFVGLTRLGAVTVAVGVALSAWGGLIRAAL